jgi:hypothetical protein
MMIRNSIVTGRYPKQTTNSDRQTGTRRFAWLVASLSWALKRPSAYLPKGNVMTNQRRSGLMKSLHFGDIPAIFCFKTSVNFKREWREVSEKPDEFG